MRISRFGHLTWTGVVPLTSHGVQQPVEQKTLTARLEEQLRTGAISTVVWPLHQFVQVKLWQMRRRAGPTPHLVKERIVRDYARRYGLRVLVETGTYLGEMVWAMRKHFDEIHSIELDRALYERAQARFSKHPHVRLNIGDSSLVLSRITAIMLAPALFWLDGHYSGGITARGKTETPIEDELNNLLAPSTPDHVILIDDARMFTGHGGYPRIDELERRVAASKPRLNVSVKDDVIRIVPPLKRT
jgi:hypothetical protein